MDYDQDKVDEMVLALLWLTPAGDAAGAVTDTYEYDAFGNKINSTGTTPNNYLYRGEQYDPDLGLYYLRARYYNPATGRFLSRDPNVGKPADPQSLHKYLYAGGDPIDRIDPRGRDAILQFVFTTADISTPTEVALATFTQGAAQFWAVVQLYAGVKYLTSQDLLEEIQAAEATWAIAKLYACDYLGEQYVEYISTTDDPEAVKVGLQLMLGHVCFEVSEKFGF
jgi:RHS repeat-associated protein